MFNLSERGKTVHFIGIGGVSMSGLALILLSRGVNVTGSDRNSSGLTKTLELSGATIFYGHSANNITNQNYIVYTAAIKNDNEELIRARELNIPIIERPELLGAIMREFTHSIAVCGTHGKTTTTGMLSHVLLGALCDPTITIGGELDAISGNIRVSENESDYFLCEACEYHESFLHLFPEIGIILNIDSDHLDYFRDLEHIKSSFKKFSKQVGGAVIVNADDPNTTDIIGACPNAVTYGMSNNADITAMDVRCSEHCMPEYKAYAFGKELGTVKLSVAGEHNILNSLSVIGAAHYLKLPFDAVAAGLSEFYGTARRFEKKGERNGVLVIDDYAHHPREIAATLSVASAIVKKELYIVFQPHTYTRTKALFDDFVSVLTGDFKVINVDIFAAREPKDESISSGMLASSIPGAIYKESFGACAEYLKQTVGKGDIVLTMGAGDVYAIGEQLLNML